MIELPLLAVDPGRNVGWALARGGALVEFGTFKNVDWNAPLGDLRRALPAACLLVIEMPRVYPAVAKWKGDPQHIVRLAFLAGRISEWYYARCIVEPRTWQGGSPPERVLRNRTRARLTPTERDLVERVSPSPHAWDAIGILVYSLNRAIQTD